VVLLKDGVLFRGSVVEQRPGDSILLRTSSGALLMIPIADVWAFVKRKQVVGGEPAPAVDTDTEPLRIRLQIELASRPLALAGGSGASEAGGGGNGGSESTLEEEIDTLERERDDADHRAQDEERSSERQALETLDKDISGLLDRLLADLQECGRQGGIGQADSPFQPVTYQPASTAEATPVGELASRFTGLLDGMLDQTFTRIPTDEVIAAFDQRAKDSWALQKLLLVPGRQASWLDLDRIRTLAARLPAEERQRLYQINQRRDGLKGALLNAIPFTMAGSWSQGDTPTGSLGVGLFLASFVVDYLAMAFGNPTAVQTPRGWVQLWNDPASLVFWAGPACYVATYAFGIILPPVRANSWNTALAKALRVEKTMQQKPAKARPGFPTVAVVPGSREEPRLEVHLLSLRY
jgi:hypothetical protein